MELERRLFHAFELLAGLNGAIAAQPVVETLLAVICLLMYLLGRKKDQSEASQASD